MKAGYTYCEATEAFQIELRDPAGQACPRALYRNISGNTALALGFVAAAQRAGLTLFRAPIPSRPPPTSFTSCRPTRSSA